MLPRRDAAFRAVVVRLRHHRARGRRLHPGRPGPIPRGEPRRDAQPVRRQPAAASGVRGRFRTASSRDLTNTDTVMNDTFFVGVYPGLDAARLDHMADVFTRFMRGERGGGRSRVTHGRAQKLRVRGRASRRARRARLHRRRCGPSVRRRASAPASSCTSRWIATTRPASGRSRASSRSPARRRERDRCASPTRCTGRSPTRMERELVRGRDGLDQAAVRRFRRRRAGDVVLFAGGTGITAFTAFLEGWRRTRRTR